MDPIVSYKDSVRVAVAQMQIKSDQLSEEETTVDALVPWIEKAVDKQADLVVFPEYLLGNFHLPNKLTDQLCAVAKKHKVNIIVGGWEYLPGEPIVHPPKEKTYANTILVVDRNGKNRGQASQNALGCRCLFALLLASRSWREGRAYDGQGRRKWCG